MNTNTLSYIEEKTSTDLSKKDWKEIVDKVILPKMAGPRETRWCINDMFMNFVDKYAKEIAAEDHYTATAMFIIGLQRIACGAVANVKFPAHWLDALPKEYHNYSSYWDEAHILTKGCYNFIMGAAMEESLNNTQTRAWALAVLFAIEESFSSKDKEILYAVDELKDKAQELYQRAEKLVEKYADFDEIYKHYATPRQWQKHLRWFQKNQQKWEWKKFFADTQADKGNFFKKWQRRRFTKKLIQTA